ncbi:hypothetical protein P4O66_005718, partial [Electrophorus voltai]
FPIFIAGSSSAHVPRTCFTAVARDVAFLNAECAERTAKPRFSFLIQAHDSASSLLHQRSRPASAASSGLAMASSQQDSSTKELHLHRREECMPYQIFPDSSEGPELMSLMHQRRRLPSIVVDPTQVEQGRGELPWPLQRRSSREEEEDDSLSQVSILSQGEKMEGGGEKRGAPGGASWGASCWGQTSPPLSSESLVMELEPGDSPSLRLDSQSPETTCL